MNLKELIDMNIDFDKLLEEAKKHYHKFYELEKVYKLASQDESNEENARNTCSEMLQAFETYENWKNANILSKGLKLVTGISSMPIAIVVDKLYLAGE